MEALPHLYLYLYLYLPGAADASLLNFTSLELYYEVNATSFPSLLTLATDFTQPFGSECRCRAKGLACSLPLS